MSCWPLLVLLILCLTRSSLYALGDSSASTSTTTTESSDSADTLALPSHNSPPPSPDGSAQDKDERHLPGNRNTNTATTASLNLDEAPSDDMGEDQAWYTHLSDYTPVTVRMKEASENSSPGKPPKLKTRKPSNIAIDYGDNSTWTDDEFSEMLPLEGQGSGKRVKYEASPADGSKEARRSRKKDRNHAGNDSTGIPQAVGNVSTQEPGKLPSRGTDKVVPSSRKADRSRSRKAHNKERHHVSNQDKASSSHDEGEDEEERDLSEEEEEEDEEEDERLPVEQTLMNNLLRYYEKSVRPVRNASDTVLVRMGLTLTQIFDMDEKNQVLVINVWLDQEWDDMFMVWDPEDYGGLKMLRLPCHKLWLPDIVLYNNAAEYTDGLMPANAMITYQGNIFWPVPTKLQSTCKVDVTYFPFDEQFCTLKFGSWTYDGFQVDMTNRTTEVDLTNYVPNGEWELIEIVIKRNVRYYACCPEPFPDVTFTIHIRRRTIYYLYNVIFPCVMMSSLTLLVFCLPPDSGEKITLGITVLLAFSVFLLRMGEDLPETSEFIPLLSIYLTIVMSLTSVSVIMTVFVLHLHHRGPNEKPVPSLLRQLFLRGKVKRALPMSRTANGTESLRPSGDGVPRTDYVKNVSLRRTIENLAQELKDEMENNCTSDFASEASTLSPEHYEAAQRVLSEYQQQQQQQQESAGPPHQHRGSHRQDVPPPRAYTEYHPLAASGGAAPPYHPSHEMATTALYRHTNLVSGQSLNVSSTRLAQARTNEDILEALKKIIERYERDDNEQHIIYEWRQVAVGVDRILFWVFLVGTLSSTLLVLVIAPLTHFF